MDDIKLYFGSTFYKVPVAGVEYDHIMSDAWVANAETQYNAMMTRLAEVSVSGVPFFISTDQHGGTLTQHRWLASINPGIKSINLGDTVGDSFNMNRIKFTILFTQFATNTSL